MNSVEFWSSVEPAGFLGGLTRELGHSGWDAESRHEVSQVDYWASRTLLERIRMRFYSYAIYPARVFGRFASPRGTALGVVSTNTFFAPWVAMIAAGRRGRPVVHWVLDLYPDVLFAAGAARREGPMGRIARRVVRSTFDRAAANVFLGSHLLAYAELQFGPVPRSVVIPVGCDATLFRNSTPVARDPALPLRILYSGNLGRMHETDTLLAAMRLGLPDGVTIDFRGNGPGFKSLEVGVRALGLGRTVGFGPNLPEGDWVRTMSAADVGLVTMRPGAEGVVMPSKTYSALAAGQAILAVCPEKSDLADTVRRHECGWIIEPGDARGLVEALKHMTSGPKEVLRRRLRAWQAGQDTYDQRVLVSKWMSVLDSALRPLP
jgi:colanic acid biosynthesis glycosyl transferase WcaI